MLAAPILGAMCVVIECSIHNASDTPTKAAIRSVYLSVDKLLGLGLLIAAVLVAITLAYRYEQRCFRAAAFKIWVFVQLVLFCLFSVVFVGVWNLAAARGLTPF